MSKKIEIYKCDLSEFYGEKIKLSDAFRKRVLEGIYLRWLEKYNRSENADSYEDWIEKVENFKSSYEILVEISIAKNQIDSIFIGQDEEYDDSGVNYSWEIKANWLSQEFINNIDKSINLIFGLDTYIEMNRYKDNFYDNFRMRFTLPSYNNLYGIE